jgi:hypothetical protein
MRKRNDSSVDNFSQRLSLGCALFSAFGFAVTIAMFCMATTMGVLLLRSEMRWQEIAALRSVPPAATLLALPTPTSTDTPTPTETPTTTPTETPLPTETPTVDPLVPPTPDPLVQPPVTPVVDANPPPPPPPPAADVTQYWAVAPNRLSSANDAIAVLNSLLVSPLPSDPNWQNQVNSQLALIRQVQSEFIALQVPTDFAVVNPILVNALTRCANATYPLSDSITNQDSNALFTAQTEFNTCQSEISNADLQLNDTARSLGLIP